MRIALGAAGALVLLLSAPMPVSAHGLLGRVESPLPLAVYLAGAAMAVGLSFVLVMLRDVTAPTAQQGESIALPRLLTSGLRAVGLLGWLWIVAQLVVGGTSAAEVTFLFLWVYGWVLTAMISALIGPIWPSLDPFTTLHDLGAAVIRRLGITPWSKAVFPKRLGRWPAVIGFLAVIWLELGLTAGSRTLGLVLLGYTFVTLLMMAQYGRDAWRRNGEVFSVWFGLLGRLAPFAPGDDERSVRRRPFASGLLEGPWTVPDVVMVALGVGAILFDGLSQTGWWYDRFGLPGLGVATLEMTAFLGLVVACVLGVSRLVGLAAAGAGLVPIAVGYLVAHYLTYLLSDGQRLIVAISDPLQLGWDLIGTAFYEPGSDWIPPVLVWAVQLAAVVGGHVVGAWAGHIVAAREAAPDTNVRLRQIPLAVLMVGLTATTLWSLGQAIVKEPGTPTSSGQLVRLDV